MRGLPLFIALSFLSGACDGSRPAALPAGSAKAPSTAATPSAPPTVAAPARDAAVAETPEEEDAPPPAPIGDHPLHKVTASASTEATQAAVKALGLSGAHVRAEAPLTPAGGTVGVVWLEGTDDPVPSRLVIVEPSGARIAHPLQWAAGEPSEVGFAELSGDGRTDVILRDKARAVARAYLTPSPRTKPRLVGEDLAALLAMRGAPSLSAAIDRALTVPVRGVSKPDVCRLVGSAPPDAGVANATVPEFEFHEYTLDERDPQTIALDPHPRRGGQQLLTAAWGVRLRDACTLVSEPDFYCDTGRPFCTIGPWINGLYLWFSWTRNGELKLRALGEALGGGK